MIGTATCFYGQTTVFPQRPLGSEAVRSLQNAQQHSCPDRANRGDLAELFPGPLLFTLRQQLAPHSLAQHSQRIKLLVVKLRSPAHSEFLDLLQPLGTMASGIDFLAVTRNGPTSINGFYSRLDVRYTNRNWLTLFLPSRRQVEK